MNPRPPVPRGGRSSAKCHPGVRMRYIVERRGLTARQPWRCLKVVRRVSHPIEKGVDACLVGWECPAGLDSCGGGRAISGARRKLLGTGGGKSQGAQGKACTWPSGEYLRGKVFRVLQCVHASRKSRLDENLAGIFAFVVRGVLAYRGVIGQTRVIGQKVCLSRACHPWKLRPPQPRCTTLPSSQLKLVPYFGPIGSSPVVRGWTGW